MRITSITIIKSQETDTLFLETDLPCGTWPYKGFQSLKTEVAHGSGEQYVRDNFPGVPLKIVDVPTMRHMAI